MQGNWWRSAALLGACSALAMGCNDLGTCDDPLNGRKPVQIGPTIMYAGQAVLVASCAAGCHSSTAKGSARVGAPEGLDFDLTPKPGGEVVPGLDGGVRAVELNNIDVAGLRARQRIVFDQRELIWEQVDKGLMPPTESFRQAVTSIANFMFGAEGACPAGTKIEGFAEAKAELRKWLACGVPIIETNSANLPFIPVSPTSDAGEPEKALGAIAYAGAVGYQVSACGVGGDGGMGATFGQIYTNVLQKPDNQCIFCHVGSAAMGGFDISTPDIAYMELLGANMQGGPTACAGTNPRPMVEPGDPAGSYFIAKLGGTDAGPICEDVMPFGMSGLNAADLQLIRDWIMAGAMR